MLNDVKQALRISTDAFDSELNSLIKSGLAELQHMGIMINAVGYYINDPSYGVGFLRVNGGRTIYCVKSTNGQNRDLIKQAIIARCKWLFGNNPDKDQWRQIYHTMLAQLQTMSGYRRWN